MGSSCIFVRYLRRVPLSPLKQNKSQLADVVPQMVDTLVQ